MLAPKALQFLQITPSAGSTGTRGWDRGLMAPAGASSQGVHRGFTSYQAFPHFLFYKQLLPHMQMTLSTSTLSPERVDTSRAWGQILKLPPSTAQESICPSRACFTGDKTLPHQTPKSVGTDLPKSGFRPGKASLPPRHQAQVPLLLMLFSLTTSF